MIATTMNIFGIIVFACLSLMLITGTVYVCITLVKEIIDRLKGKQKDWER